VGKRAPGVDRRASAVATLWVRRRARTCPGLYATPAQLGGTGPTLATLSNFGYISETIAVRRVWPAVVLSRHAAPPPGKDLGPIGPLQPEIGGPVCPNSGVLRGWPCAGSGFGRRLPPECRPLQDLQRCTAVALWVHHTTAQTAPQSAPGLTSSAGPMSGKTRRPAPKHFENFRPRAKQ